MESRENMLSFAKEVTGKSNISDYHFIEAGWNSVILVINGNIALKFPRSESSSQKVEYEQKILSILEGFPFKTPQYRVVAFKKYKVGIYPFIEGRPLSSVRRIGKDLLSDFSRFFEYTFNFDLTGMTDAGITVVEPEEWIHRELSMLEEFQHYLGNYIYKEFFQKISMSIKEMSMNLSTEDIGLIHGDFYRENIVVSQDCSRINGIIDWGESGSGDLAFDLAALSVDFPEDQTLSMIPHKFQDRSQTYLERIRIYKKIEPLYNLLFLKKYNKDQDFKKMSDEFNNRLQDDKSP